MKIFRGGGGSGLIFTQRFQNPHFQSALLKSGKCLIPRRDSERRTEGGPIVFTYVLFFHLIVVREGCLTLSIYRRKLAVLKSWKCFIPRRYSANAEPNGVNFDSFHFIVVWKGIWHFQNPNFQATFLKSWKCFIPRRDSAKQSPMGSILILSILLWSDKGIWHFQFKDGISPKKPWKCFIPQRDSAKQCPMGSIWIPSIWRW